LLPVILSVDVKIADKMKIINTQISFREMIPGEETDVVDLVLNVFSEFVAPHFSEGGILEFKKFVNTSALEERFQSGNPIIVALFKNEIIGVIEIRDNSHIALLFVGKPYQKKGVAKKLFGEVIKICREKNPDIQKFTVNSSPNAYAAYQKFGFKGENAIKTVNGIRFIPMEFELKK
jgi:GNAT superfamily N-acetyltransferase